MRGAGHGPGRQRYVARDSSDDRPDARRHERLRCGRRARRIGSIVAIEQLKLLSEHSTARIDFVEGEVDRIDLVRTDGRIIARERED